MGDIPLGGKHPIRVQSMTTTDTMDTDSTVNQSIRMIKAGSEYIRITAPSINEAKNLYNIKKTCNADTWRKDYFGALFPLNPSSIIPQGESISKIVNQ